MPPKKRKAAASSNSSTPAKKVRISGASHIPDVSPTGRPKRTSVGEPQYNFTSKRKSSPADQNASTPVSTTVEARKRGRPAKTSSASKTTSKNEVTTKKSALKQTIANPAPRGRGRPAAIKSQTSTATSNSAPAKRGRKPKTPSTVEIPDAEVEDLDSAAEAINEEIDVDDEGNLDHDIQYWLMKAEPESRIEKGHDVKFSIDDLASKNEPEGWDGVRNAVARNNMRAMRKGDLAFFYHSNCAVPGIAGVMRIVEEHTVDESAFDPNHPYYDPKSDREKPKWELVKVEFVKKLEHMVTLRELKSLSLQGNVLEDMVMIKQSRLSVSPVTADQWRFILDLAGEKPSLGHPTPQDGYEPDIDSEGRDDDDAEGDGANDAAETSPTHGTTDDFSLNILTSPKDVEQSAAKDVDEQGATNGITANGVVPELTKETLSGTDAA